jgi:hypothetical protein
MRKLVRALSRAAYSYNSQVNYSTIHLIFCRPGESTEHSQTAGNDDSGSIECQNTQEQAEKKLRGLKKQIQQIEKLKSKQDEGEVLEDLQVI